MKFFVMLSMVAFLWSSARKAEGQHSGTMVEIMTMTTCEQHEGNPWQSVGLVEDAMGLKVFIVENDEDKDTAILKATFAVKKEDQGHMMVLKDERGLFNLWVEKNGESNLGIAALQFSVDKGITLETIEPMYCYEHVSLSYLIPE